MVTTFIFDGVTLQTSHTIFGTVTFPFKARAKSSYESIDLYSEGRSLIFRGRRRGKEGIISRLLHPSFRRLTGERTYSRNLTVCNRTGWNKRYSWSKQVGGYQFRKNVSSTPVNPPWKDLSRFKIYGRTLDNVRLNASKNMKSSQMSFWFYSGHETRLTQNQTVDDFSVSHLACAVDWCVLKHVQCINAGSELNQQLHTVHVTRVSCRM